MAALVRVREARREVGDDPDRWAPPGRGSATTEATRAANANRSREGGEERSWAGRGKEKERE